MSLLDVQDALLELLEPGGVVDARTDERTASSGVIVDHTGREPIEWMANHVYAFPDADEHRPDAGQVRQEFEVLLIYVSELTDEEPRQERRREVTEALNAKRDAWMAAVADNRSQGPEPDRAPRPWSNIWARAEFDYVRALGVRGVAVRVIGWRFLA